MKINQTIHVAYALDDNFTEMTCVSMASLLHNTKRTVHFHVIEGKLSQKNKDILLSLKNRFSHGEWSFYKVNQIDESMFPVGSAHFTSETYCRLLLPELFPHIEKMIYLDGDTIVEGDISELWSIELGNMLIGAVPCIQDGYQQKKQLLGMAISDLVFNGGVLLLNLKSLREFELYSKAESITASLYESHKENNLRWYVDQDILNHLCHSECLFLPVKFNLSLQLHINCIDSGGKTLQDWHDALISPVIIHFTSEIKPSKICKRRMAHPMWERYYVYKELTPFSDIEADNKKIKRYRHLEENSNNTLFTSKWAMMEHFIYERHSLFSKLADNLHDMLQGKKLALWGTGVDIEYIAAILSTRDIYADVIVDGLPENQGKKVFHYSVQDPEILLGKSDEYFVLLCMRNEEPAAAVMKILNNYGYDKSSYHHIYAPLWDVINGSIII